MIKSMTGFGHSEVSNDRCKITVEMKSVNHRYLDVNIKMPKKLSVFESTIRTILKEYAQRGKVDIYIAYEDYSEGGVKLKYNKELAASYMTYLKEMSEDFEIENDIRVSTLSRFPEVLTLEEVDADEEELKADLEEAFRGACVKFVESRTNEGENLKNDLMAKLDGMLGYVGEIEERAPEILAEYKSKLMDKVADLLQDAQIEEGRILGEVTLFADKICVDEEIVRLKSHVSTTKDILKEGGSVGRRLDFIAQEMNREANTILSKANDLITADTAISLKTDIEKVREQIQNIE